MVGLENPCNHQQEEDFRERIRLLLRPGENEIRRSCQEGTEEESSSIDSWNCGAFQDVL